MTETLYDRWQNFWKRMEKPMPEYAPLLAAYNRDDRHYHNMTHLRDVLAQLDFARDKMPEVDAKAFDTIELALWYHDIVYDPRANNNEDMSARWLLKDAKALEIAPAAAALVRMTAHHKTAATTAEQIMADCDLAILGAAPDVFKAYDKNIRKEYAHVPDAVYQGARIAALKTFTKDPPLFKTIPFREKFEAAAAKNLSTRIAARKPGIFRFLSR